MPTAPSVSIRERSLSATVDTGAVGYGVWIAGNDGATFTNSGTISAGRNGRAIVVEKQGQTTSAKIILAEQSKIEGQIQIKNDTRADIVADGMARRARHRH